MGKLILIRHGHTSLNRPGENERLRGWLDVPLDDQGLIEAEETAGRVAGCAIETIYSSDLSRALQTSAVIGRAVHAPVVPTDGLRPWNVGAFGGHLVRELVPFLDLLREQPDTAAPGGESWNQFYARFSARLFGLLETAAKSKTSIAAVTHVRNFLAAPSILRGTDKTQVPVKGGPATAAVFVIEQIGGAWQFDAPADQSGAPASAVFASSRIRSQLLAA
jgi:probable phosphoglycerate mutase